MKKIWIVYKKELLDTLRDKRTLRTTIIIPAFLLPLIIFAIIKIQSLISEHNENKAIHVVWLNDCKNNIIEKELMKDSTLKISFCETKQQLQDSIKQEKAEVGLITTSNFSNELDSNKTAVVKLFFNSKDDTYKNRMTIKLELIKQPLIAQRLIALQLDKEKITPIKIEEHDIASTQEIFGKIFGGFLPYIFIIYSFMGCMMLCVDLFTGEKERGTIETILTSPVNRLQIMFGKIGVAVTGGTLTAVLSIAGILLFVRLSTDSLPLELVNIIGKIFTPIFIIKLLIMIIPLTVFFSGILTPVATYARNYREATSIIAPFNFIVIMPAMMALLPGVKLNLLTSLIPVTNIALCTKYMIAGDSVGIYWWITVFTLTLYGSLAVLFSYKRFSNEQNILR
jgi:sodium transport system permease protein